MKDNENKNLDFVVKHYKEGKFNPERAITRFRKESGFKRPLRSIILRASAVAASLLIGAFVLTRLVFTPQSEWVNVVATNENISVYLPDSTEVVLMAGSQISYDIKAYAKDVRQVNMSGKAYFDVRRDESAPFKVWAKVAKVEVLGTQFSVAESSAATEVYVESGRVRLSSMDESSSEVLTKGMSAELTNSDNRVAIIETVQLNPLAWANGEFVYENTPLQEVLAELSDYYDTELSCQSSDKSLTATFETDSLDEIIMLIESVLDIKIVRR